MDMVLNYLKNNLILMNLEYVDNSWEEGFLNLSR